MNAGETIDSRYRLERLLGTGGMGEVWLAEDERLGRWVAVKLLRDDAAGGGGLGIEREARLVARLQHPNIVAVLDTGRMGWRPYLVMEYVHGLSLRELMEARGGRLSETEAVKYAVQVAGALAYAHEKGVFHSDIKPENVLVTEDGIAKALDFGIAQTVNRTLSTSEARAILGTIAYLAPEVIQGSEPDERSDIYALGLTVYELIAGRLPFGGSGAAVMAGQRLAMAAPPLRTYAPEASASLESALARALALDPGARFASANDFAASLRHGGRVVTSQIGSPAVIVRRERPVAPHARRADAAPPGRTSRAPMFAAIAIAGGAAIVGGTVAALVLAGGNDGDLGVQPTRTATAAAAATATPTRAQPTVVPPTATTAVVATTPTPSATATRTLAPTATTPATVVATFTPTLPPSPAPSPTRTATTPVISTATPTP